MGSLSRPDTWLQHSFHSATVLVEITDPMAALTDSMQLIMHAQLKDRQRRKEMREQRLLDIKEAVKRHKEKVNAAKLCLNLYVQREKDRLEA